MWVQRYNIFYKNQNVFLLSLQKKYVKLTKEFKAGLIVIGTFLAFWYMFQFLKGKNLFTSGNIYYVNFAEVSGLEKSKPVTINGLRVGRVESIEPKFDSKGISFKVELVIGKDYPISRNTIAQIHEPGLMSGKEIQLLVPMDNQIANSEEYLKGNVKSSFTSMLGNEIKPMKDSIGNVISQLDQTLLSANKAMISANDILDVQNRQNIKLLLVNLNQTVAEFKATSQQINQLVSQNNPKISSILANADKTAVSANQTMAATNETVKKFGTVADKFNKIELDKTITKLENTLGSMNIMLEKINRGEGSMGKLIYDEQLYANLNASSKSLDNLLKDLKESPKRYLHFSIFGTKGKQEAKTIEITPEIQK